METGIVIFFDAQRGFGFLTCHSGASKGKDIFVHYSAIVMDGYKTLIDGATVEFGIETGPKGKPQACNVRPL
jgi:CspA family cold shock protein